MSTPATPSDALATEPDGSLKVHSADVPIHPVAPDAQGIDRIVGPTAQPWTPAQVDPTEDELARAEEIAADAATRREFAYQTAVAGAVPQTSTTAGEPVTGSPEQTPEQNAAPGTAGGVDYTNQQLMDPPVPNEPAQAPADV